MGVQGVESYWFECGADFLEVEHPFIEATRQLVKLGCEFMVTGPYPRKPHLSFETVEAAILKGGIVPQVNFLHPLLRPKGQTDYPQAFEGWFCKGVYDRWFKVGRGNVPLPSPNHPNPEYPDVMNEVAQTRVEFDRLCVPVFKPKLTIVDDFFGDVVKHKQVQNLELKKLFWRTYYGPEYTEKYGREFLLNTPSWKTEEFEGGVIVTVCEHYHEFQSLPHKDTLKYLSEKFKAMKVNVFSMGNF